MGLRTEVSERQRRFGEELRRLRDAAGVSAPEMGAMMGMKGPAVSHTEAGRLSINLDRLHIWLEACRVTDPDYRAALIAMSESTGKGWWTSYRGLVRPTAIDLAEAEASATALDNYETFLIPGLLQTKAYSEVILEYAEKKVEFRRKRQQVLDLENGPPLRVVIHEAALRTNYGGPRVMRNQLNHLVEVGHLPHVTLQVLPFDCTVYADTDTPFMLVAGQHPRLDTVLLEHPHGSFFMGDPEGVAVFRRKFEQLRSLALPPLDAANPAPSPAFRDSSGLIQHIRYTIQGR
ncbi:helix-turn-helix domain-containing protein [Streptomyces kaniharaensis]|uniref:helix-turn-helix domain-containing protein n=1 Tax=Streptomyces kaniharaensis TaxID=212423 RepID=UPI0018A864B6|nr:helix-turn-helix transcriptional regulator [Streptomyces kaniharaensis]